MVFYGLPTNPQFYPELINMITNSSSSYTSPSLALEKSISKVSSNTSSRDFDASTMVLFTKYDQLKLERIIGAKRTEKVIKGEKEVYMFC